MRHSISAAGMILLASVPLQAAAQSSSDAIVETMIDCAEIEDISQRVGCYDATIALARQALQQVEEQRVEEEQAVRDNFGNDSLPREQAAERPERPTQLSASVERSRLIRPGIYSIALDNGSEWQFTEGVPSYYFPPRAGTQVTVERGALGSYRMLIEGKAPVRVRRTR